MGDQPNDRRSKLLPERAEPKSGTQPTDANTWALAGTGIELAAAVAAMSLLGWWLDGYFGTGPWLAVTGALLGVTGGLYNLWKHTKRYL